MARMIQADKKATLTQIPTYKTMLSRIASHTTL